VVVGDKYQLKAVVPSKRRCLSTRVDGVTSCYVIVISQAAWTVMTKPLRKQGRLFLFLSKLTLVIHSLRTVSPGVSYSGHASVVMSPRD
jgi:hypothetical protein